MSSRRHRDGARCAGVYVGRVNVTPAAICVIVLALSAAGCGGSDSASSQAASESLRATQTKLTPISQSRQGFQPGDAFIASSELAGGGHKEAYCVIASRKHTDWCAVTIVRPRGQITAEGVFVDAPKLSGQIAVLSGSGAYEGVTGTLSTSGLIDRHETLTLGVRK